MKTFKFDSKFSKLLYLQRHQCRAHRQDENPYDMRDLYKELYRHYRLFQEHLPTKMENALDIGCGLGYIDVVLFHQHPKLTLHMFDSMDDTNKNVGNFYNNLILTKKFLMLNGVPKKQIRLVDASSTGTSGTENLNPEIFKDLPKMDLVISCYAYGWHSRISKYIKEISGVMNSKGLLVLDCKGNPKHVAYNKEIQEVANHGFEIIATPQVDNGRYVIIARKI